MNKTIFKVTGMSCAHCEKRVEDALKDINVKAKANAKKGIKIYF